MAEVQTLGRSEESERPVGELEQRLSSETPEQAHADPPRGGRLGRVLYTVWDNLMFTGEVLVDFLNLDKPRYHDQIEAMRRIRRREERAKKEKEMEVLREEAEAIGRLEDPDDGSPFEEHQDKGAKRDSSSGDLGPALY